MNFRDDSQNVRLVHICLFTGPTSGAYPGLHKRTEDIWWSTYVFRNYWGVPMFSKDSPWQRHWNEGLKLWDLGNSGTLVMVQHDAPFFGLPHFSLLPLRLIMKFSKVKGLLWGYPKVKELDSARPGERNVQWQRYWRWVVMKSGE